MNWRKLDYRLTLSFYNTKRRLKTWFLPKSAATVFQCPRTILIGATFFLGDLVMQAPLIQALRAQYPAAKIHLLVSPGFAPLAKQLIGVDEVFEAKLKNGRWLRQFRKEHFKKWDLGVIPFICFLIPLFYGLDVRCIQSFPDPRHRRRYQIHHCVPLPKRVMHLSRMVLLLIGQEDAIYLAPHFHLKYLATLTELNGKRYVVIHPGAGGITRLWPVDRYVQVAKVLIQEGYHVVLTGNMKEIILCESIATSLPQEKISNLAGKIKLENLLAVLKEAVAVVGPDTGVLHVAKALKVPCVILLGPGQYELFAVDPGFHDVKHTRVLAVQHLTCRDKPYIFLHEIPGVGHCRRAQCLYQDVPCMLKITVDHVIAALQEIGVLKTGSV